MLRLAASSLTRLYTVIAHGLLKVQARSTDLLPEAASFLCQPDLAMLQHREALFSLCFRAEGIVETLVPITQSSPPSSVLGHQGT